MYITKCAFGWTFFFRRKQNHILSPWLVSGDQCQFVVEYYWNVTVQDTSITFCNWHSIIFFCSKYSEYFFLSQFSVDSISLNFIIGTLLCKKKKSFISTWFMNKMFKYWILLIKIMNKHIYLEKFQCVTLVSFDFY